jgi:hypothetical protein
VCCLTTMALRLGGCRLQIHSLLRTSIPTTEFVQRMTSDGCPSHIGVAGAMLGQHSGANKGKMLESLQKYLQVTPRSRLREFASEKLCIRSGTPCWPHDGKHGAHRSGTTPSLGPTSSSSRCGPPSCWAAGLAELAPPAASSGAADPEHANSPGAVSPNEAAPSVGCH